MRLAIDSTIALMLVTILAGVVINQRRQAVMMEQVMSVQESVRAIQSQSLFRAAVKDGDSLPNGFAKHINVAWFDHLPKNMLAERNASRWIDHVTPEQMQRINPEHIVTDGKHAAFWYNPHRGLVRARVPMQLSQKDTVDLYNLVNGTSLRTIDCRWGDELATHGPQDRDSEDS